MGEDARLLEIRVGNPSDQLTMEEIKRQVREKVDQLPDEERKIIKATYWRGVTQATYARESGKDKRRVSEVAARARRALEQLLKDVWFLYVE